jgi:hypothetical protein
MRKVGPGDAPADLGGAEEATSDVLFRGPVTGARKRMMVQMRSELMMIFDMATISW